MATEHDKLPGGCYVKQIYCNKNGIHLKPPLLNPNGFTPKQSATLLIMQDHILITLNPKKRNIMLCIQELQLRQDEMKKDFEPAVEALLRVLLEIN